MEQVQVELEVWNRRATETGIQQIVINRDGAAHDGAFGVPRTRKVEGSVLVTVDTRTRKVEASVLVTVDTRTRKVEAFVLVAGYREHVLAKSKLSSWWPGTEKCSAAAIGSPRVVIDREGAARDEAFGVARTRKVEAFHILPDSKLPPVVVLADSGEVIANSLAIDIGVAHIRKAVDSVLATSIGKERFMLGILARLKLLRWWLLVTQRISADVLRLDFLDHHFNSLKERLAIARELMEYIHSQLFAYFALVAPRLLYIVQYHIAHPPRLFLPTGYAAGSSDPRRFPSAPHYVVGLSLVLRYPGACAVAFFSFARPSRAFAVSYKPFWSTLRVSPLSTATYSVNFFINIVGDRNFRLVAVDGGHVGPGELVHVTRFREAFAHCVLSSHQWTSVIVLSPYPATVHHVINILARRPLDRLEELYVFTDVYLYQRSLGLSPDVLQRPDNLIRLHLRGAGCSRLHLPDFRALQVLRLANVPHFAWPTARDFCDFLRCASSLKEALGSYFGNFSIPASQHSTPLLPRLSMLSVANRDWEHVYDGVLQRSGRGQLLRQLRVVVPQLNSEPFQSLPPNSLAHYVSTKEIVQELAWHELRPFDLYADSIIYAVRYFPHSGDGWLFLFLLRGDDWYKKIGNWSQLVCMQLALDVIWSKSGIFCKISKKQVPRCKRVRLPAASDPLSEDQLKRLEKGFGREIKRLAQVAKDNRVVMSQFSFQEALLGRAQSVPPALVKWDDASPRIAVSNDGFGLVVHLPGAIREASADILLSELVQFVHDGFKGTLSLAAGADGQTRGQRKSYNIRPGQVAGLFKLVRAWLPIGHPHDNPVPSRDMLKTGKGFAASLQLIAQLRLISHRVNCLIDEIDPTHSAQLQELHASACKRYRFYDILGTKDPLYMEGRELMYNRQTPLHADKSDPKNGWAVLVVVGPFTGGDLFIPCLNLQMRYTHGTMIMVRGKLLPHEVFVDALSISNPPRFVPQIRTFPSFEYAAKSKRERALKMETPKNIGNGTRFPNEVLGEVFVCVLADNLLSDPITHAWNRRTLQKVCSSWAHIVWGLPEVWRMLYIDEESTDADIRTCLHYAGALSLDIFLDLSAFDRRLGWLEEFLERKFDVLDDALGRCETLLVQCEGELEHDSVVQGALPVHNQQYQKHRLTVKHSFVQFGIFVGGDSLTRLEIGPIAAEAEVSARQIMDALVPCKKLTHLRLSDIHTSDVPSRSILDPKRTPKMLHLTHLAILCTHPSVVYLAISLKVPNLQYLDFESANEHLRCLTGLEKGWRNMSWSNIRSLRLTVNMVDWELCSVYDGFPRLQHLDLRGMRAGAAKLLAALHTYSRNHNSVAPTLSDIHIQGPLDWATAEAILVHRQRNHYRPDAVVKTYERGPLGGLQTFLYSVVGARVVRNPADDLVPAVLRF
ncbi:hypothetical protein R3P38DRAFT_2810755 [Favolaschia claudopus]|uniref:F-box domain-containing protein n=1 Tax=Favolaschia claudopus TaxID=2862362 RepID=A0AAV9ZAG8_9AGAR